MILCDFRVTSGVRILDRPFLNARRLTCMGLQTLSVLPGLDLPVPGLPEPQAEAAPLAASARMEFQAALQLLAERAAFVTAATGVAIALDEHGSFVYRVAAGTDVPEPEIAVDRSEDSIKRCLRDAVAVRISGKELGFELLVPVRGHDRPAGFIRLVSAYELPESDVKIIGRLAELASVALEHMQAAERTDARFWEQLQEPLIPRQWHAPERTSKAIASEQPVPSRPAEVHLCRGCGFPVSPGRKLCVECELKPEAALAPSTELFAVQPQPNWFTEHGYTVASLIVSALAAIVIFWLRR